MCKAQIFDIQHYCIHDGPGIRTTIFLKGCNLACAWCHNPESQISVPQLLFYPDKCLFEKFGEEYSCKVCSAVCLQRVHKFENGRHIVQRENCINCGKCTEYCPADAIEISGSSKSLQQIMREILRDKEFYIASAGGVTFSGGEPLIQIEPLCSLLLECRLNGIHTAIETACNVPTEHLMKVLDNTDLLICDIKAVTPSLHKSGTGCKNDLILRNIRYLLTETDKQIWIRIPVISGFNDNEIEFNSIAEFICSCLDKRSAGIGSFNLKRVELLPFHDIGKSKYHALGMEYLYGSAKPPSTECITKLKQVLREKGIDCVI